MESHRRDSSFQIPPQMVAPQLMNPPPQIFGAYSQDGMPMVPVMPDLTGSLFDPQTLMEDTSEGKRRRIARACDMCRKKKIKCDGKLPACTHCLNYKTECVFTQVEKKRAPPKGAKYIEGLENRLGRMESLLRLSGLLTEEDDASTDLGTLEKRLAESNSSRRTSALPNSVTTSPKSNLGRDASPASALTSPDPSRDSYKERGETPRSEEEVEALSDMMCSLVTNNCGETRYIGSSSGFSIFSPKGIQWVNEKTGDTSFQEMISESAANDDTKFSHWKPEIFSDLFQRPVYAQLPTKAECISLLKDYFENFNCMFPLFHQPTFMHLVERQYSRDPYSGSGWWASLNVALAIAHRLRVMSNLVPQEEDLKAWGYLKNALGVYTELTLRNTDLLSVQALLGMALFLQGTPNPQPTFFLVAAALRVSHSIGLHKRGSGFNLNPIEIEQRKRVFWIAYMLDKDICIRSGRPPVQDDDDMNVDLPSADPDDNIGNIPLADGKGKVNLFRLMCEFAVIESKVYKRLYSVKATRQSDGELLNTIGELDQELEEWKDSIPIDFRPEHEIKASHTPLILHVVMLHFAYYNCLTTIHRMSIHHGYWTSRLSNYAIQGLNARPLNPRVYSSAALCVTAARASISLVKYIPQGDFACVWLISYFPVSALVTLFGNILQNPLDPRGRSDVRLMNLVVNFLSTLEAEEENAGITRMLTVCSEFERIAKVVLEKADKEQGARRKRKTQDNHDPRTNNKPTARPASKPVNSQSTPQMQSIATPHSTVQQSPGTTYSTPPSKNVNTIETTSVTGSAKSSNINRTMQGNWPTDGNDNSDFLGRANSLSAFGDIENYTPATSGSSPLAANAFQNPFVPQDLWQLPMSLEWDWAEMTGAPFPGFENSTQYDSEMNGMGGMHTNG